MRCVVLIFVYPSSSGSPVARFFSLGTVLGIRVSDIVILQLTTYPRKY